MSLRCDASFLYVLLYSQFHVYMLSLEGPCIVSRMLLECSIQYDKRSLYVYGVQPFAYDRSAIRGAKVFLSDLREKCLLCFVESVDEFVTSLFLEL